MLKLDRIENGFLAHYPDRIVTIDSHTQGEPTRLLISGVGSLPGRTIKDKRDYFESHYDHIRMLLTREPRGHRGIMAAMVTEPISPEGQFGLFYMDARRYPYLCGHATIGAVASLIDAGAMNIGNDDTIITVDTPSGPLDAHTRIRNGRVPLPLRWCHRLCLIPGVNLRSPNSERFLSIWFAWAAFSPWCRPDPSVSPWPQKTAND